MSGGLILYQRQLHAADAFMASSLLQPMIVGKFTTGAAHVACVAVDHGDTPSSDQLIAIGAFEEVFVRTLNGGGGRNKVVLRLLGSMVQTLFMMPLSASSASRRIIAADSRRYICVWDIDSAMLDHDSFTKRIGEPSAKFLTDASDQTNIVSIALSPTYLAIAFHGGYVQLYHACDFCTPSPLPMDLRPTLISRVAPHRSLPSLRRAITGVHPHLIFVDDRVLLSSSRQVGCILSQLPLLDTSTLLLDHQSGNMAMSSCQRWLAIDSDSGKRGVHIFSADCLGQPELSITDPLGRPGVVSTKIYSLLFMAGGTCVAYIRHKAARGSQEAQNATPLTYAFIIHSLPLNRIVYQAVTAGSRMSLCRDGNSILIFADSSGEVEILQVPECCRVGCC